MLLERSYFRLTNYTILLSISSEVLSVYRQKAGAVAEAVVAVHLFLTHLLLLTLLTLSRVATSGSGSPVIFHKSLSLPQHRQNPHHVVTKTY